MTITVELPDGKRAEFPDGTSKTAIRAAIAKRYPPKPVQKNPDGTYGQAPEGMFLDPRTGAMTSRELLANNAPTSTYEGVVAGGLQGMTFGTGDEIMGAIGYLEGGPDMANLRREQARANLAANREANPVATYGSEVLGAAAIPVGSAASGGRMAAQVGRGMAVGAGTGAAYGFGTGEGDAASRAKSAASGAAVGAAVGGLVPLLAAALTKPVEAFKQSRAVNAAIKAAPSADDLKAQAQAIYAQADNVQLPRSGMAPQVQSALDDANRLGMDPMLTPSASRVADNLTDAATNPRPNVSYRELDILRRQAGIPAGDINNRPQSAMGVRFQEAVDNFIEGADPTLSADLAQARQLWGKLRRMEMVNDILDRADGYLGGQASGVRNQIGSILRNPKKLRGFSEAEVALMRKIASGGLMNRFATLVGGGMGRLGAMLAGGATGGIEGAAVGAAIGQLGRTASDNLLMKQGYALRALAASGGASLPKLSKSYTGAVEALLMGAGRVGANELQSRALAPR